MPLQINRQILDILTKSNSLAIVVGGAPTIDSLGSALALSLALSAAGKRTQVVTQNPIRAEHSRLVGCDKVENQLKSTRSFVISLPNAVDTIEKISCYAQEKTLNIVLQPYGDVQNFEPKDMQYSRADADTEAVVFVDVPNKQEVTRLFGEQSQLANQVPNIAVGRLIDHKLPLVVSQPNSVATAEIVHEILAQLHLQTSADVANNLLQAIYDASDDFHAGNVTPELFELSAHLLKLIKGEAGSRFAPIAPASNPPMPSQPPVSPRPGQNPFPRPASAPGQQTFPRPSMPAPTVAGNRVGPGTGMGSGPAPSANASGFIQNEAPQVPALKANANPMPQPLPRPTNPGFNVQPRGFEIDPFLEMETPLDAMPFDDIAGSRQAPNPRDNHMQDHTQRESFGQQTAPRQNQQPRVNETKSPNDNRPSIEKPQQNNQKSQDGQINSQQRPSQPSAPKNVPADWLNPPQINPGKTEDLF